MITDGQARRIASEWHSGQGSALYSLASCGSVAEDTLLEIVRELKAEIWREDYKAELNALAEYVLHTPDRPAQDGWSSLWDDERINL
jgi:hypothetical protein